MKTDRWPNRKYYRAMSAVDALLAQQRRALALAEYGVASGLFWPLQSSLARARWHRERQHQRWVASGAPTSREYLRRVGKGQAQFEATCDELHVAMNGGE